MDKVFELRYIRNGESFYSNVAVRHISYFCEDLEASGYELLTIQDTECTFSDERRLPLR